MNGDRRQFIFFQNQHPFFLRLTQGDGMINDGQGVRLLQAVEDDLVFDDIVDAAVLR